MKCRIRMIPSSEKFNQVSYVVEYKLYFKWFNIVEYHKELLTFFDLAEYYERGKPDYFNPQTQYSSQKNAEDALNNFCKLYFKKQQLELQDKVVKIIDTKEQGFVENL